MCIGGGDVPDTGSQISAAMERAAQLQKEMYEQERADLKPGIDLFSRTVPYSGSLLGIPGYDKIDPTETLRSTPGYQFIMDQGVAARDKSAAARGNLYSGAHEKGLTTFGEGIGDQTWNNYLGNVLGLNQLGFNSGAQVGNAGQNYANQAGQYYLTGANAQAQQQMAQYQADNASKNNMWNMIGTGAGILGSALGTAVCGSASLGGLMGTGLSYLFGNK
jgi:hypothetical protein